MCRYTVQPYVDVARLGTIMDDSWMREDFAMSKAGMQQCYNSQAGAHPDLRAKTLRVQP